MCKGTSLGTLQFFLVQEILLFIAFINLSFACRVNPMGAIVPTERELNEFLIGI
jgi:heme/copper-type cytochrome/quinol oxidase subunit 3